MSPQTKIGDADMLVMAGTQSFVGDVLRQYQTEDNEPLDEESCRERR